MARIMGTTGPAPAAPAPKPAPKPTTLVSALTPQPAYVKPATTTQRVTATNTFNTVVGAAQSRAASSYSAPHGSAVSGPKPTSMSPQAWIQSLVRATGALQKLGGTSLVNTHLGFQGYINPIPGAVLGRTDMGVDINLKPGDPILALGTSKVLGIAPNWYQGQPYVAMQLLDGPQKGNVWYVAEQIAPAVQPGQTVKRGQPIGTYAPSGTGIEIGWGSPTPGRTLAQATTGYHEGQVTPAGTNFRSFLGSLKTGKPTTGVAATPAAAVASGPQTQYAAAVLKGIGAPATPGNIAAFRGWAVAEGGDNWARNNPLNTTESAGATGSINSVGVKVYPSPQAGVAATVKTLKNGNYGGILNAFRSNSPQAVGPAVASSPWGTGSLAIQTINQALGGNIPAAQAGTSTSAGSASTGTGASSGSAPSSGTAPMSASGLGQSGQAGANAANQAARLSAIMKLLASTTSDVGGLGASGSSIDTGPSAMSALFGTGLVGMPTLSQAAPPRLGSRRGRRGRGRRS